MKLRISLDTLQVLAQNDEAAKCALARILVNRTLGKGDSHCYWRGHYYLVRPLDPKVQGMSYHAPIEYPVS